MFILDLIKKPDGSKWKATKLDYYTHEKMRLEKVLENLRIKFARSGHALPSIENKLYQKYENKIKELDTKIQLEKMKQR